MIWKRRPSSYVNQRNFAIAIASTFLLLVIGYFGYQLKSLRSPRLDVLAPATDVFSDNTAFDVHGRTDAEADVTLNGRPLFSDKSGEFSERIYLVKGVNTLEFEAKNRYKKTTQVIRYVVRR